MKTSYLGVFTISLYALWTGASFAEQENPPEVINYAVILSDPKIVAALVAATVTIFVNVIGKLFLDRRLEAIKADLKEKGDVNSAKIQYELEEKKRLYHSIGHLRFQLLLSARDVALHVTSFGAGLRQYPTTTKNYYGQSTLYKFLRPIALCELIERQVAVADFSVDVDSIELLRFKQSIYKCFSSGDPILHHPDANWLEQEQHVFYNSLTRIANSLLIEDSNGTRSPMSFHQFVEFLENEESHNNLSPLPEFLEDFSIEEKPLLWLRFVFFGYLCSELVNEKGARIGFEHVEYPLEALIRKVDDQFTLDKVANFTEMFKSIRGAGL